VLLRGLGRWQIFPGDDVGARKRLQAWLELAEPLDYLEVGYLLARWRPFGGLIYFHLLLSHLMEEGDLATCPETSQDHHWYHRAFHPPEGGIYPDLAEFWRNPGGRRPDGAPFPAQPPVQ